MRVSRKLLDTLLAIAAETIGARVATAYNDVGGLEFDHDITGYRVSRVVNM